MEDKMKTLNRKQTRATIYNKPTKFIALNVVNAYIHPTKGYRGNKKAIAEYRAAMGYK
jgi:hypothetical protein